METKETANTQGNKLETDAPKSLESVLKELAGLQNKGSITPEEYAEMAQEVVLQFSTTPAVNRPAEETAQKQQKTCSFCGEQILAVAIKCKHCGSNLSTQNANLNNNWYNQNQSATYVSKRNEKSSAGQAVGILGAIIALGCFFGPWVSCTPGVTMSGADLAGTNSILWLTPVALFAALGVFAAMEQIGAKTTKIVIGILTGIAELPVLIVFYQIYEQMSKIGNSEEAMKILVNSTCWGFWVMMVGTLMMTIGASLAGKNSNCKTYTNKYATY